MNPQYDCALWRQGDVFEKVEPLVFDHRWQPTSTGAQRAVITSQSCDAAHSGRQWIQIAPVVDLTGSEQKEAASGRRPQFAAVPSCGETAFADLDGLVTVHKAALTFAERTPGLRGDKEVREFAFSVARRFGRFAFPAEVVELLRPVTDALRDKARRINSPIGAAMTQVHSLRVACSSWSEKPYQLTLILIAERGVLPTDLDDLVLTPQIESELALHEDDPARQLEACLQVVRMSDPARRYFAWHGLVDAWARLCTNAGNGDASVEPELTSVDEFPLSRVVESEALDLDYLSEARRAIT